MKKIALFICALSPLIAFNSCKSAKKNQQTNVVEEVKSSPGSSSAQMSSTETPQQDALEPTVEEQNQGKPNSAAKNGEEIYAFTASFYSIGEGTDGPAINNFREYIAAFNSSEKVNLSYESNAWGREGEIDFCFLLEELSAKQRIKFIEGAKKLFTEKNLVHLAENGRCHPKR